jgi:hypothetical protein
MGLVISTKMNFMTANVQQTFSELIASIAVNIFVYLLVFFVLILLVIYF